MEFKKRNFKSLLLVLMGLIFTQVAKSESTKVLRVPPLSPVLLETITTVGFAAPDYVGVYQFQVLDDGRVQKIDNKKQLTYLAMLSPDIVKNLRGMISSLPKDLKVTFEDGPKCADAPMVETLVKPSVNSSITIYRNIDCLKGYTNNAQAIQLANWMRSLKAALDSDIGRQSFQVSYMNTILLGQEGYGAPEQNPSKSLIFSCREEVAISDDGFEFTLNYINNSNNLFELIIKRSLLTGPKTESYQVIKKSGTIPGAALHFASPDGLLMVDIQQDTTTNPEGLFHGKFTKSDRGYLELRDLICKYK